MAGSVEGGVRRAQDSAITWLRIHPPILLLIIFLFHAVNTIAVVSLDRMPLFGDEGWLFEMSGNTLRELAERDLPGFLSSLGGYYPPLHRLVSLPFYLVFGYTPDVAVLSTLPAALALIISVYHIGKELKDSDAGLLAAALVVLLPGAFGFSRTYFQEFTLMATTTLTLALMLKSRGFKHRGFTMAFGMSIGLGLLAKWSFTPFVMGPILFYVYQTVKEILRESADPRREVLARGAMLLSSVVCGLLIASWWYLPNLEAIFGYMRQLRLEDEMRLGLVGTPFYGADTGSLFFKLRYLFLIKVTYAALLQPAFFFLAVASLLYLLLFLKRWPGGFICSWFALPVVLFVSTFSSHPIPRFIVPYLPAFALPVALGCMGLPLKMRRTAVSLVLLIGIVQLLVVSYFSEPRDPLDGYPSPRDTFGLRTFDRRDWRLFELTATLNAVTENRPDSHALVLNHLFYTPHVLGYLQQMGLLQPFEFHKVELCIFPENGCERPSGYYQELFADADIVLVGGSSPPFTYPGEDDFNRVLSAWNSSRASYGLVRAITFPDGQHLAIYSRGWQGGLQGGRIAEGDATAARIHYDENSGSLVLRSGSEADFLFRLSQGVKPKELVLQYSAYRPEGLDNPRFSVLINGIPAANVSEEPPYPWEILRIAMPAGLVHNGTLEVRIKSNTYADSEEEEEEQGIAIDWFSFICEQEQACLVEWTPSRLQEPVLRR